MFDGNADGYLRVDVQVDKDSYEASLNHLEAETSSKGNKITGVFAGIGASIGMAITGAVMGGIAAISNGVSQIINTGIEFNKQMETYTMGFETFLGDAEKAAAVMEQIKEDAARTPFDVSSLTQANQLLVSAGVDADDARDTILALGDAVSATGGGSAELSRMAQNLQQVKNVGKASSMDIKQFAMAGINIYGILADYTGKTTEEVQEMEISYEMLTGALQHAAEEGGMFYGSMQKQSETLAGQISTFKDNFAAFAGELTEGIGPAMGNVMDKVSEAVFNNDELKESIQRIFDGLGPLMENLADIGIALLPPIIDLLGTILPILGDAINFILPGLEAGFEAVGFMIETFLIPMIELIKDVCGKVLEFLKKVFLGDWEDIWEAVKSFFGGIWETISKMFKDFVNAIIDGINQLISGLNNLMTAPDWVPVIGGKGLKLPMIPHLRVGMDYVPNDDFPAVLHQGEAVLTAAEANVWRAQKSAGSVEAVQQSAELGNAVQALAASIMTGGGNEGTKVVLNVDYGRGDLGQLARILNPYITAETARTGVKFTQKGLVTG